MLQRQRSGAVARNAAAAAAAAGSVRLQRAVVRTARGA